MQNYKGEQLREFIKEKIMETGIVVPGWECVAKNLEKQELGKYLLKQLIHKLIDIRTGTFVNNFLFILKRKLAKGQEKQPAVRKKLN